MKINKIERCGCCDQKVIATAAFYERFHVCEKCWQEWKIEKRQQENEYRRMKGE